MTINAALAYADEAYHTAGPRLMGAQAASEAFLRAWISYSGVERFYCQAATEQHFKSFEQRIGALGASAARCVWVPTLQTERLREVGCLYHPDAYITHALWQRQRGREQNYSICGVTHTTCSEAMMDLIGSWAIAPAHSWDAVICTSQSVLTTVTRILDNYEQYLRERLGATRFTRPELPVIPLGVDVDRLPSVEQAQTHRRVQRALLGIGASDVTFLFFGRLSYHAKAHPLPMFLALEAAARRSGKSVQLILAGWFANNAIEKVYLEGAARHCPSVKVKVVDGRRADIREQIWYAADVFTSLSDNIQETFGLTPIEAMAAGLPLVISDWNGYRDTVRHGQDGFLVPTFMPPAGAGEEIAARFDAGADTYDRYIAHQSQCTAVDVAKCAEHYYELIQRPELRHQLGESGRVRAREVFAWRRIIGQYQQLWQELASRRKRAEVLASAPGVPRNPLREDPLALFANYPTRQLTSDVVVRLTTADAAQQLLGWYRDPLANFAGGPFLLATFDESLTLLATLSASERSVGELAQQFSVERRGAIVRTLGWLLKIGLATIG